MNDTVTQMGAMSAALRMLLAGHPLRKPADVLVAASNGVTPEIITMMMSHAGCGRTTFLALFDVEDDTALLSRVMIVDGTTTKRQINIGGGKFVQKADGSYAILSINRDQPYEYSFSHGGRHLERQSVPDSADRAMMELSGMQALVSKAGSPACLEEARTASISHS